MTPIICRGPNSEIRLPPQELLPIIENQEYLPLAEYNIGVLRFEVAQMFREQLSTPPPPRACIGEVIQNDKEKIHTLKRIQQLYRILAPRRSAKHDSHMVTVLEESMSNGIRRRNDKGIARSVELQERLDREEFDKQTHQVAAVDYGVGRISDGSAAMFVRINDSGRGFNPNHIPNPFLPENMERGCGNGVLLAGKFIGKLDGRMLYLPSEETTDPESVKTHDVLLQFSLEDGEKYEVAAARMETWLMIENSIQKAFRSM